MRAGAATVAGLALAMATVARGRDMSGQDMAFRDIGLVAVMWRPCSVVRSLAWVWALSWAVD